MEQRTRTVQIPFNDIVYACACNQEGDGWIDLLEILLLEEGEDMILHDPAWTVTALDVATQTLTLTITAMLESLTEEE